MKPTPDATNTPRDYGHDEAMRDLRCLKTKLSHNFGLQDADADRLAAYIERLERKAAKAGILLSPDSGFDLMDERDALKEKVERLEAENARLQALTGTLAGKHPEAAEMLFRERKLNETLMDMKDERDALRARIDAAEKVAQAAEEATR